MCHVHDQPAGAVADTGRAVTVDLPEGELLPAVCRQASAPRGGPVLIVSDVYGPIPFYRMLAARLARSGRTALLPDYFFRQGGLPELTREHAFARHDRMDEGGALRDLGHALAWLREHEARDGGRVGVLGFCLGGTLAFDLAADRSDVAAVSYYGFPHGMPHPRPAPRPVDRAADLSSPTLAFWGADDDLIGQDGIAELVAAVADAEAELEHLVYPDAGHGFLRGLAQAETEAPAAHDSWRRTLGFFHRHLDGRPAEEVR